MNISRELVIEWLDSKRYNDSWIFRHTETEIVNDVLKPHYKLRNIDYNYTVTDEDNEAIYQLFLTDQMPDKYVQEILEFSISNL